MRKRLVLVFALAAGLAMLWNGVARADCAVGGFVTNKSKGAIQQLLAFTTNGTFFLTYAGAITTGTSGCSSSGIVKDEYEQELFVSHTYDGLTQDMARGEGQYLRSFAALMGCDGALYPDFAEWSQAHAADLAAVAETPDAWVGEVKRGLALHPRLSGCTRLS